MNTVFVCEKDGCVNQNVVYTFEGKVAKAECGGCGKILKGTQVSEVSDASA